MSLASPGQWCDDCYGRHTRERRLAILRLCSHMTTEELRLAWAHFWPQTPAGKKLLHRDRKALREGK